jgi:hypothetical protein
VANAGEVDTVEWVPVRELATRVPGDPTRQLRNISLMPALWNHAESCHSLPVEGRVGLRHGSTKVAKYVA